MGIEVDAGRRPPTPKTDGAKKKNEGESGADGAEPVTHVHFSNFIIQ